MPRIQCKGCDYKPSEHDTLEGYCMTCAGSKIKEVEQLQAELKNRTVTEQMKAIQRQVGCKKIDGEIGTETTPLVNAQVRAEKKRELMNQYAVESFNRMAGDTK